MEYSEICKSYHSVRDMQLKLLTLIPIASGTAASVVIKALGDRLHTVMVGLLGFALTLGLFLYSLRGTQHANALSEQGSSLEEELGLSVGQFKDRPTKMTWIIGYETASTLIYMVILIAWGYAIKLGL
jgi:hypothetical protein